MATTRPVVSECPTPLDAAEAWIDNIMACPSLGYAQRLATMRAFCARAWRDPADADAVVAWWQRREHLLALAQAVRDVIGGASDDIWETSRADDIASRLEAIAHDGVPHDEPIQAHNEAWLAAHDEDGNPL